MEKNCISSASFAGLSVVFQEKRKKIEIEGRNFSLIFYANFEKLKFYRATKSRAVYSNRALGRHLKLSQVIVNVKSSL